MRFDVVALGELLFDFIVQKTDTNEAFHLIGNPGGAPANFLACLSKMGCKTAFLGKVGIDMFGVQLCQTLQKLGISTEGLILDPDFFTTLAFVHLDKKGERSFSFARKPGADTMLFPHEIDEELFQHTQIFHFGSLSLTQEPCRSATQKAVGLAQQSGCLLSYDPNLRPALWEDMDKAREEMLWGLEQCNWVKISLEECVFLWPQLRTTDYISAIFKHPNIDAILLTKGKDGAIIATRTQQASIAAPQVHSIDTTGAGDICGGAALSRLLKLKIPDKDYRLQRADIQNLTLEEILEIGHFAVVAGSLSTEKPGAIPSIPDKNQIKNKL